VRTLKIVVAYDGAPYVGWQRQAHGVSIQGLLEAALARLDGAPVTVVGAGRTDAGVHALGQVARAVVLAGHPASTLHRALNAMLPPDVRVVSIEDVDETFHPRFDAHAKCYQYWMWNGPVLPPALRTWCWHVPGVLDTGAMSGAAHALEGRHDFAAFQSSGSDVTTSVRTMFRAAVWTVPGDAAPAGHPVVARLAPHDGRFVVCELEADGYLRHMVRAIVGTLVEIGALRRAADSVDRLLRDGTRPQAGRTAPAHGLVLVRVTYPPGATPGVPRADGR
jgi:tRNA pseudouridine38-40 synthase